MAEIGKMQNDPDFVLEVLAGPSAPELVPQKREDGVAVYKKYGPDNEPKRFIIKAAHLSTDDWRIWDHKTGKLVYNGHHPGKNPVGSIDKLGTAHQSDRYSRGGEWESYADVTGHQGYPNFKIRPKTLSRHGTQYLIDNHEKRVMNVSKQSMIKTGSLRPGFDVCVGEGDEKVYHTTGDLMERTMQIFNEREEVVCFVQRSGVSLIQNAAFGNGSEYLIDVAPGVDCSTMLIIILGIKQVGAHFAKDALGNWVTDPFKDAVVDGVIDNTGELGQAAVQANNKAVGHADKVADKGHGRHLPLNVKLPPDAKKKLMNTAKDYKGFGK
ncbi:hypothetical protein FVE85_8626 [Porphyridium purpureum]|uniref:Uncharacterized protein n=1 Tax=Porphyridium purpureum TaxID=35688 RepID=A0A5J4YNS7_PORPP|nr:hypothetical protein FVE85_8626 [Porphyridium purpureum]|eukprot:POR1486..scf296_7